MTNRASLQLGTARRAPPQPARRRREPETSITSTDPIDEITNAIAELQRLDQQLRTIDQNINQQSGLLEDADEWDQLTTERTIDDLNDKRSRASFAVAYAANRVIHYGTYLVGEWRDIELDNIARRLSQTDGLFGCVKREWPGIPDDPIWQRVYGEAAPF
jgi:hypothetical protein